MLHLALLTAHLFLHHVNRWFHLIHHASAVTPKLSPIWVELRDLDHQNPFSSSIARQPTNCNTTHFRNCESRVDNQESKFQKSHQTTRHDGILTKHTIFTIVENLYDASPNFQWLTARSTFTPQIQPPYQSVVARNRSGHSHSTFIGAKTI